MQSSRLEAGQHRALQPGLDELAEFSGVVGLDHATRLSRQVRRLADFVHETASQPSSQQLKQLSY